MTSKSCQIGYCPYICIHTWRVGHVLPRLGNLQHKELLYNVLVLYVKLKLTFCIPINTYLLFISICVGESIYQQVCQIADGQVGEGSWNYWLFCAQTHERTWRAVVWSKELVVFVRYKLDSNITWQPEGSFKCLSWQSDDDFLWQRNIQIPHDSIIHLYNGN